MSEIKSLHTWNGLGTLRVAGVEHPARYVLTEFEETAETGPGQRWLRGFVTASNSSLRAARQPRNQPCWLVLSDSSVLEIVIGAGELAADPCTLPFDGRGTLAEA